MAILASTRWPAAGSFRNVFRSLDFVGKVAAYDGIHARAGKPITTARRRLGTRHQCNAYDCDQKQATQGSRLHVHTEA